MVNSLNQNHYPRSMNGKEVSADMLKLIEFEEADTRHKMGKVMNAPRKRAA